MVSSEVMGKAINLLTIFLTWLAVIIVVYLGYRFVLKVLTEALMYRAKTRKERDNVVIFVHVFKYVFIAIIVLFGIFIATGSLTGLGLIAGLLTAGLGFALQKPILGIAAWLMIIIKKPFQIDDRVMIGDVKGDVADITVSHVHLKEIGGTIEGEDTSGRLVMIPTSIIFEKNVINYTVKDEFIRDEVNTLITYESKLNLAKKICYDSAKKHLAKYSKKMTEKPVVLVSQKNSGIELRTRYYVRAQDRMSIASAINEEILNGVGKTRKVEIAYPHVEILRHR